MPRRGDKSGQQFKLINARWRKKSIDSWMLSNVGTAVLAAEQCSERDWSQTPSWFLFVRHRFPLLKEVTVFVGPFASKGTYTNVLGALHWIIYLRDDSRGVILVSGAQYTYIRNCNQLRSVILIMCFGVVEWVNDVSWVNEWWQLNIFSHTKIWKIQRSILWFEPSVPSYHSARSYHWAIKP